MKNRMFFLVLIFLTQTVFAGGFSVGNGGDIIRCPILEKYLSLDYVLTGSTLKDLVKIKTKEESFERIGQFLEKNVPELALSYRNFAKLIFNKTDFSQYYIWRPIQFLKDLPDEEFFNIPGVCGLPSHGAADMHQAIIREFVSTKLFPEGQVVFSYEPETINLLKDDALQISFLFTHEWIWKIAPNAKVNRQINRFLHSEEAENLSATEVRARLKSMGAIIL